MTSVDSSRGLDAVLTRLQHLAPQRPIVLIPVPSFAQGGRDAPPCFPPRFPQAVISAQLAATRRPGVQVWSRMQAMGGATAHGSQPGWMAPDWIPYRVAGDHRSADLFRGWRQSQAQPRP